MRRISPLLVAIGLAWALFALGGCDGAVKASTEASSSQTGAIQPRMVETQVSSMNPNPMDLEAETVLTPEDVAAYGEDACFTVTEIPDAVFERMLDKTYKPEGSMPRDNLRYIRILHKNAEGQILTGEIVMHKDLADEICEIFHELYLADYPIERVRLADDYDADDTKCLEANNTSAYNHRLIEGTNRLSNHARGTAIDINTFYNPYYIPSTGYISPNGAEAYIDRTGDFPYKIAEGDLCYNLFMERGYTWGGHWNSPKDYQHFEKPLG